MSQRLSAATWSSQILASILHGFRQMQLQGTTDIVLQGWIDAECNGGPKRNSQWIWVHQRPVRPAQSGSSPCTRQQKESVMVVTVVDSGALLGCLSWHGNFLTVVGVRDHRIIAAARTAPISIITSHCGNLHVQKQQSAGNQGCRRRPTLCVQEHSFQSHSLMHNPLLQTRPRYRRTIATGARGGRRAPHTIQPGRWERLSCNPRVSLQWSPGTWDGGQL